MQILTFYQSYLNEFYRKNNRLASLSYEDQIQELYKDGFGGGHVIAPYLEALGYESNFIVANNSVLQNKWFEENNIFPPDKEFSIRTFYFVKAFIESYKPDILYLTDPEAFNDSFINSLSYKPSLIIAWRSAPTNNNISWKSVDVLISNNTNCMSFARKHGVNNVETYFPGFPNIVNSQLTNVSQKFDVVFSGQYSDFHQTRNQYLKEIAIASNNLKYFSYAYYLSNSSDASFPLEMKKGCYNAKWGLDMFKALKEGKICFNAHIDFADNKNGGNMRLFETTGVGAFSLVEWKPVNLDEYFESGKEIETFRSKGELIEKIHYYLAHSNERETIAKRGQERCLREYSMEAKAKEFDQIIRKYLAQQKSRIPSSFRKQNTDGESENILKKRFPGITIGKGVQIVQLDNISIGPGSLIGEDSWLSIGCSKDNQLRIKIGKCVCIGRRNTITSGGFVEIGDYCLFAPNVYIGNADHIYETNLNTPFLMTGIVQNKTLVIEENCWIGINSFVSGSITIGRGSVIAGNTVVLENVPPFSIVVGNPSRIVKMYDPVYKSWIRIKNDDDIKNVIANRDSITIPSRDEYRNILDKRGLKFVDPGLAGQEEYLKYSKNRIVSVQNITNLINKAKELLKENNNEEALHIFDQATFIDPENNSIQYGRAITLSRLERIGEAEKILKNILMKQPGDKTSQHLLDEILANRVTNLMAQASKLLDINKNDMALKLLNKAKSFKRSVQGLDYLRGIFFLRINQTSSAFEALKEELRFFPNNYEAKELLNQIVTHLPQSDYIYNNDKEFCILLKAIRPYTMLSEKRLYSLFNHTKKICIENIPGNFVECGVAAGGSSALIASVIKKYSKQRRKLYSFDSFEGMPEPTREDVLFNGTEAQYVGWGTGTCSASKEYVMNIWSQMSLSDIIIPVEGYFEFTLPQKRKEIGSIALLHLDGDWYNSTKAILDNLYDNLITGGILQVDDYGHWAGCKKAIHEFELQNNLKFAINNIDGTGVWFCKK